jgi:hypothetical protein
MTMLLISGTLLGAVLGLRFKVSSCDSHWCRGLGSGRIPARKCRLDDSIRDDGLGSCASVRIPHRPIHPLCPRRFAATAPGTPSRIARARLTLSRQRRTI